MIRHLGPTLLCTWVLWGMAESSGTAGPNATPWRVQATYSVYWACVQAAKTAAILDQGLASNDGADATWAPVGGNDHSSQYSMMAKFKNGKTGEIRLSLFTGHNPKTVA
jgi:hypothetical protein